LHSKYLSDDQTSAYFTLNVANDVAGFLALGSTVGSHTVAHSPVLDAMPMGTGSELYPTYLPYDYETISDGSTATWTTPNGTVFGEVRVSKSLIDGMIAGCGTTHNTVSFRAGELSFSPLLPQTLEETGYFYDSSRAIGDVYTNFPFRQMRGWLDPTAPWADTAVFEFPLTIEDELPPAMLTREPSDLAAIAANADNGAPSTILIHPNVLDYKLQYEQEVMRSLPAGVLGMGLEQYGVFWRARDGVTITAIAYDAIQKIVSIGVHATYPVVGLTLRTSSAITSAATAGVTVQTQTNGDKFVILPPLTAGEDGTFVLNYQ
jgi:hypothetical protein